MTGQRLRARFSTRCCNSSRAIISLTAGAVSNEEPEDSIVERAGHDGGQFHEAPKGRADDFLGVDVDHLDLGVGTHDVRQARVGGELDGERSTLFAMRQLGQGGDQCALAGASLACDKDEVPIVNSSLGEISEGEGNL